MKALLTSLFILFSLIATAAETSASDSVITVKQVYTSAEPQPLNKQKAQHQALKMCQARDFDAAQALSEEKQVCERYTGWYECFYRGVEQQYQCLNQ